MHTVDKDKNGNDPPYRYFSSTPYPPARRPHPTYLTPPCTLLVTYLRVPCARMPGHWQLCPHA